jgi:hypothetical protein
MEAGSERSPGAQKEIASALHDLLEAAERKDFVRLESFHDYGPKFSKWDSRGPGRLDAEATRNGERSGIGALDAFRPSVEGLKIDVFGETAVATFVMPCEIVAAGQTAKKTVRATLVWVRVGGGWKVVHEHLSALQN